jgi:biotin-dependent carboxylase-like uncharacterized protein
MEIFRVMEPGPFTTVQDLGRYGYQQFGVPVSGALDAYSARVANLLLGNPEGSALLEITFKGPKLQVLGESEVVVTGAELPVLLNDEPRPCWTGFPVRRGDLLSLKEAQAGLRAYLAVTGGIDVPLVMGSRSTYAAAKLGGYEGRPLAKGDLLSAGPAEASFKGLSLPAQYRPRHAKEISLRAVPGPQDDRFDSGLHLFFASAFKVSSKADRMGYRLVGPNVELKESVPRSIISEPCLPGGVQIPPDGQPIILLVEQTVGGYAKIATVISSDLPLVAQARPDDIVRFCRIDLRAAHKAALELEERLQALRAHLLSRSGSSG